MATPTQLIDRILERQKGFETVIAGLDAHALDVEPAIGEWPVKLVACHLGDWIEEILTTADAAMNGRRIAGHPITDFDRFNHEHIEKNAGDTCVETITRLDNLIDRAVSLIGDLDEQQLATPAFYPWGGEGDVAGLLDGIAGHHDMHLQELATWRQTRPQG